MMVNLGLKICSRCILPESFPHIKFDEAGVCNHCRQEESIMAVAPARKQKYCHKFDELVAEIKGKASNYDVIMAYSGGKDSSYVLRLLKEKYNLRIIALTFDNHFVSPAAWENVKAVTDHLQIDLIRFRPPWPLMRSLFRITAQKDVFPAATLLRASSICTGCITMVKSLILRTAIEMSIPLAAYGWSPGQAPIQAAVMKTNPNQIHQNQNSLKKAFPSEIAPDLNRYLIPDRYYESHKERFPYNIHPLAFFDYDEAKIISELQKLGWKLPEDTDSNSTNCLLNAFANQCHIQRHGFHPYVLEIASMVRQAVMTRQEGIEKIYAQQNPKMVAHAKERLGL
jgi:hypothetical protein